MSVDQHVVSRRKSTFRDEVIIVWPESYEYLFVYLLLGFTYDLKIIAITVLSLLKTDLYIILKNLQV